MSAKDINTGIEKSIEAYIKDAGETDLAKQIDECFRSISRLENVLTIDLEQLCYESLCSLWENTKKDGANSLIYIVNDVEVKVNKEVFCTIFGVEDVPATIDPKSAASRPTEFWKEMALDKNASYSAQEVLKSFRKEYQELSKLISKCIIVQCGAHNTLSLLKLNLMEIICKKLPFNWAGFLSEQMVRHLEHEEKLEKAAKTERTSRFRATKSCGFILQTILDHFEVEKVTHVSINPMRNRGLNIAGDGGRKKKEITLVQKPTKTPSVEKPSGTARSVVFVYEKSAELDGDNTAELRTKKRADHPMSAERSKQAEPEKPAEREKQAEQSNE